MSTERFSDMTSIIFLASAVGRSRKRPVSQRLAALPNTPPRNGRTGLTSGGLGGGEPKWRGRFPRPCLGIPGGAANGRAATSLWLRADSPRAPQLELSKHDLCLKAEKLQFCG